MDSKGINWWRTPLESPDLDPTENMWHKLKEYVRREIKPQTNEQLIDGIVMFCNTLDADKCQKYIDHLRKVFPKVIELDDAATGYNLLYCILNWPFYHFTVELFVTYLCIYTMPYAVFKSSSDFLYSNIGER